MTMVRVNGLPVDVDRAREWRRKSAEKYAQKRRAKPLRAVSKDRAAENRQRRRNLTAAFGTDPLCVYPDCTAFADDAHEVLSRARGGSITDPANIAPLCRSHHDHITTHPLEAAALGLSISAFGGNA